MGAVGSYLRHIQTSADKDLFTIKTRAAIGDPNAIEQLAQLDPNDLDNIPAEHIKAAHEAALAADETRAINIQNSNEFVALHPELLDHKKNGEQFNKTLDAMFGANRAYTLDQFEQAYRVCLANNSLELDQTEVVKQQQAETNARRKASQDKRRLEAKRQFNPDEDYSNLSLDEIRQRADGEIQRELERRAYQEGLR